MTTKTLTGTYSAGYTLNAKYSKLVIATTARVYGAGIIANSVAAIVNYGTVTKAGDGVYLKAGGSVTNGSASNRTALITGEYEGIDSLSSSPSVFVTNFGTIEGLRG